MPQEEQNNQDTSLKPDVLMHRKIGELESSDVYKNADSHKKADIQKQFYTKYVVPVNEQNKSNISLFDWTKNRFNLEKQTREASKNKDKVIAGTSFSDSKSFEEGAVSPKVGMAIAHGGQTLLNAAYEGFKTFNKEAGADYEEYRKENKNAPSLESLKPWQVKNETIENLRKRDELRMEAHYDDSLKDAAVKEVGTLAGQAPAFIGASGLLHEVGLEALVNPEIIGKTSKMIQLGARVLYNSAEGYLAGTFTGDDPKSMATGFAVGAEVFRPVQHYLGKLLALGGDKLVAQSVEKASQAVAKDAVETKVSPLTVVMAGTPKQKVNAATVRMLTEMVGGDWAKAGSAEKKAAIKKLAKAAPELAGELGAVNKSLVEADAAISTSRQRATTPEFNDVLSKLEKTSNQPTAKTISESVANKATARQMVKKPGSIRVGAAKADSLEFEDNFSKKVDSQLNKFKLGKDKIVFEDRGHKLLFYMNLLMTENRRLGPSASRNKEFDFLVKHLNQRYPDKTFPELVKMGDEVWNKLELLTKSGHVQEGEAVHFFRQSTIDGSSPAAHELKLIEEAKRTEEIENKLQFSEKHGDLSKAPEGKERRESVRVDINDPTTIRDMIDSHSARISMYEKDLFKKGTSEAEKKELKNAISVEERMKNELKIKLQNRTQAAEDKKITGRGHHKDTDYLTIAREKLFPGVKDLWTLTTAQRTDVINEAQKMKEKAK